MKTPVVVFTYNRPSHTERLFQSLARCASLDQCSVHVYCDGPKEGQGNELVRTTRHVVERWAKALNARVIERPTNIGLARSVVEGVTELCGNDGCAIVLEDDLVVSSGFIEYTLAALERYRTVDEVLQISGYMHPVTMAKDPDSFFLPLTTTWGWATWNRAWLHFDWHATGHERLFSDKGASRKFDLEDSYPFAAMLRNALLGKNDSWGIRWWYVVFSLGGLVLHPRHTLVWNGGFDSSGRHCGPAQETFQVPWHEFQRVKYGGPIVLPERLETSGDVFLRIKNFIRVQHASQQRLALGNVREKIWKRLGAGKRDNQ
jgi:hypothetical protein